MKVKSLLLLLTLFLFISSAGTELFAQSVTPEKVMKPVAFDKSEALRDTRVVPPGYRDRSFKERVIPNKDVLLDEFKANAERNERDPLLQYQMSSDRSTATIGENFAGIPNLSGVAPPDTDGDVGPNHYMQMVNLAFQIFDKNGNTLYGPADNSTLWSGFTGPWTGTNDGDPIVLYDEYADRWIASQFSLPNYPSGPFYELIAVSETGDPTGAWYRYAYEFSSMPDYPKFGVWPDGYYFTINQFAPPSLSWDGAGVCVCDRAAMISGDPNAEMLFFDLGTAYGSLLPADSDGPQPPAGTPNYLMNLGSSSLRIWEADIDWVNTGNSSVNLVSSVPVASYSTSVSIDQPGTSQNLDGLSSRLMYRLQYRNFGTHEVMLTNHSVNADGSGRAGVRWYELRNTGGGWSLHQQGTFAPADGDSRWMGSVAMNGNGDIGIGYSVSSSSTYPSIRFAGQTASNSGTGLLDVDEGTIVAGTNSQTGVDRWGDYSMMSIDPVDDATFWYTTEYSGGGWNWQTQIASFSFEPPVIIAPIADFSGNPTAVMEGQTVSFTDLSQNNPTSWSWSFPGGSPATSTSPNPVVTYPTIGTYDVTLTVSNSAGTDTETKIAYIDVSEFQVSWCSSSGSNTSSEWINRVDVGSSYSNPSGNDGGYGDFTGGPISLENGTLYSLVLEPGFSGRSRREFWRVWIDYNMDGDFTDGGELVYSADGKKNTVNGSFTTPAGLQAETRMRVSMKYQSAASSCEQFTYGEVEDYTVQIGDPVPQPPVADFSGTPTTVVEGNSVVFNDATTNNPTSWSWTFSGGVPATSNLQNPTVVYNTEGSYTVALTATNAVGSDTKTVTDYITVVPEGGGGNYCASASTSNALEWISQVSVGGFSNPSGASFYSDFTGQIAGLNPGSGVSVQLIPAYTGSDQREFWRIWIDYNGDGDFEDTGEEVFKANNKKGTVNGSFTVASGVSGQTRMRVTMKRGGAPVPCETFDGGEVEDYTVDFGNGPSGLVKAPDFDLNVYPNPASSVLNVAITSSIDRVYVRLYDALGRIIESIETEEHTIQLDLNKYSEGVYYIGAENGVENSLKKFIKE